MNPKYSFATKKDIAMAMQKRSMYASKRENGSIVLIAGSEKFHGAPVLAYKATYSILAALRIGIGYATAFVPKSILVPARSLSPDTIIRPLKGRNLGMQDVPTLTKKLDSSQCVVIGPGMGKEKGTINAACSLFRHAIKTGKKVVVDADAIYALATFRGKLNMNFILTPNDSEFKLFHKGNLKEDNLKERIEAAVNVAQALNCVVLLKGHNTIITDGKRTKVVKAKSAALAVMGTGDVLSGIIGGFAVNSKDMFIAGVAGAYLHTIIGDKLHEKIGDHILASDVVDNIAATLKKLD